MLYPEMTQPKQSQQTISNFGGLNRGMHISENEFRDTENLCMDDYPVVSSMKKRYQGYIGHATGCCSGSNVYYIINDTLFYGPKRIVEGFDESTEHELVLMGARLCIFPEKLIFDTTLIPELQEAMDILDLKHMDNVVEIVPDRHSDDDVSVTCSVCREDGSDYGSSVTGQSEPVTKLPGMLWYNGSAYQEWIVPDGTASGYWKTVSPYTFLDYPGIEDGFNVGDGIKIDGLVLSFGSRSEEWAKLNGYHVLKAVLPGRIVFPGDGPVVSLGMINPPADYGRMLTISREVPDMDFVVEAQNRLWGCKYGKVGEEFLNEIYATKLGDPTNWRCYNGLSTASYTASRGSDGPWTGAITVDGNPMFFKENSVDKVYVSSTGAHQITTINCRGIQSGSAKSAVVVDGLLIYRSPADICAWNGSQPTCISDKLGVLGNATAIAGAQKGKYYVTLNGREEFSYDTRSGIWMRECVNMGTVLGYAEAVMDGRLYRFVTGILGGDMGAVYTLNDTDQYYDGKWRLETGTLGLNTYTYRSAGQPSMKFVQKVMIRLALAKEHKANLYVEYDSSGKWEHKALIRGYGLRSFTVPVIPKRCDHFRIKIEGDGEVHIYSITKIIDEGSDVRW